MPSHFATWLRWPPPENLRASTTFCARKPTRLDRLACLVGVGRCTKQRGFQLLRPHFYQSKKTKSIAFGMMAID
ncbi:hypothetical protein EII18_10955 [Comamonadaceae bacterium OH3737_COT-264]|nr:hypothetical protein EII18_10955 [Comamonadaceae bacterium OH3737_COT-264]